MWARVVEVMLGCWLAASPFVFGHQPDRTWLWVSDLACAAAVVALALVSYWRPLEWAHLGTGLVATWLVAFGFLASPGPAPPALQNDILVGLLLAMFAIIPNEANLPPRGWRRVFGNTGGPPPEGGR